MGKTVSAAVLLFALAGCVGVQGGTTPEVPAIDNEAISVWVQSEGAVLPMYDVGGQHYLLGLEGAYYQVALANRTDVRIEAVVSVDGLDVITGQVADFKTQRGYVLGPGEQILVEGFRRSLDAVAGFQFTTHDASYAAQMGQGGNVGVIGVAVFDELPRKEPVTIAGGGATASAGGGGAIESAGGGAMESAPSTPVSAAKPAPAMDAEMAEDESMGTGWGDDINSQAEVVPFKRRTPDAPLDVVALFYNDRAGLERAGVVFPADAPIEPVNQNPNPFPGVEGGGPFAPAPAPQP